MRIYVPATSTVLKTLRDNGKLSSVPMTAFAVTPGLREHYLDDDIEELEYAASAEAARASLRLLDADDAAARRRVVVAADVADADVAIRDDLDRGVVQIQTEVPIAWCASIHCDDQDAEATIGLAATHILAADLGDVTAEELVDDAEGFELSWYATQELGELLAEIG